MVRLSSPTVPCRPVRAALVIALSALTLVPRPVHAARKKKRPSPTPTRTPVVYDHPRPQPAARAAGSCLRYEPGQFLVVAEVGEGGRVFRIDAQTEMSITPRIGSRVRVLYVDGPDGPIARKVMPGPVEVTPTPGK